MSKIDDTIIKAGQTASAEISAADLAAINVHALRELSAEEVFIYRVVMCDNEIDRTYEVFPLKTLKEMASLFVGRTVISDHMRKATRQISRIYATDIEQVEGTTATGEKRYRLVAKCYIVRTEANKDLIADIESGIRKEVSVSCAIGSAICSVCGVDNRKVFCRHLPGREYEGKQCYFKLEDARDAYELSFVAVPTQRNAGVIKNYGGEIQKDDSEPEKAQKDSREEREKLKLLDTYIFINKEKDE